MGECKVLGFRIFFLFGASRGWSSLFSPSLSIFLAFSFPFDFCFGIGVSSDSDKSTDGMSDVIGFSTLADCMGLGLVAVNQGRPRLSDLPGKKYLQPCEADDVADGAAPINTGIVPVSIAKILISL